MKTGSTPVLRFLKLYENEFCNQGAAGESGIHTH
jgi:hypothetical protein